MERNINYRAQFKVQFKSSEEDQWPHILTLVSNWINQKNANEKTRSSVYRGIQNGDLNYKFDGLDIVVKSIPGNSESEVPQFFALRFSHLQTEGPLAGWRNWITDIGMERIAAGDFLFHMTNSYQTKNGFIGKTDTPVINSPNIVRQLVNHNRFTCLAGDTTLKLNPVELNQDNVKSFIALIFDKLRTIPLIYISLEDQQDHLIDPYSIASKVVGNAIVYFESERSISEYLRSIPYFDNYRCSNGAVRIYMPEANYKIPSDYRKHRFYTSKQILEEKGDEVERVIAESLVRRSAFIRPYKLQSIDSVDQILIDEQLTQAIKNNISEDIIASYKLQLEHVRKELTAAEAELVGYCGMYDDKENEVTQVRVELKVLEKKVFDLGQLNQQLSVKEELSSSSFVLDLIPNNLHDLLALLIRYYPTKLVILEEAYESSKDLDIRRDLDKAWMLLRSIPENLHPLMFSGEGGDKLGQYRSGTTFDISMTESKMTKNDKRLVELRTRTYNGKQIEINAHVGYGNKKPSLLRVHFYISSEDRKIVIGHCGEHLDNFSTRNRT